MEISKIFKYLFYRLIGTVIVVQCSTTTYIYFFCLLLIAFMFLCIGFNHTDTTGTVRKTGGNFKEKLRELGGLDAVFEVAMECHSVMEV